jgi:hypothetical protein
MMHPTIGVTVRSESCKTLNGNLVTQLTSDASCRLNVWVNLIAGTYPVLTKVARCVLTMPAAACATERNRTIWGQVFIKTRSCLGLQRAQDMIYVKQNDQLGRDAASGCPS